ncbi:MAG: hypothetical protein GXY50_11645 [Syntrophomonadaceae bacterium]|nr:hypothetical protein [Syntrophomonadaceae bacterium]
MKKQIEYVFARSFTPQGYSSFLPNLLSQAKRIVVLRGVSGNGRSTFLKRVGLHMAERGFGVQFWPMPLDPSFLDGIYLTHLDMIIVNQDSLGDIELDRWPGLMVKEIDLGQYCEFGELLRVQEQIADLSQQLKVLLDGAQVNLEDVQKKKRQLSARHEGLVNEDRISLLKNKLIGEILDEPEKEAHYFASAVTSDGLINFFQEATWDCKRRYILQGPPGSEKSRLMWEIGKEARKRGYPVRFYHSGIDPDCLELVVVEGLQVALADGDFVRMPPRPGDREVSLLEFFDGWEAADNLENREAERRFAHSLYQAVEALNQARQVEHKLCRVVTRAMNFDKVDTCREELIYEILELE